MGVVGRLVPPADFKSVGGWADPIRGGFDSHILPNISSRVERMVFLVVKKQALLREIKDLFEWINSRYADEKDNLTNKDVQELRLRLRSLQSHVQ